jgi:hypothetical protein
MQIELICFGTGDFFFFSTELKAGLSLEEIK